MSTHNILSMEFKEGIDKKNSSLNSTMNSTIQPNQDEQYFNLLSTLSTLVNNTNNSSNNSIDENYEAFLDSKFQKALDEMAEIIDWKGTKDRILPLIVGLTIKSIQEDESNNQITIKATITLKLPISPTVSDQKKRLNDLKHYARYLLTNTSLNINKDENKCLEARNCKLNKNKEGKFTDYSISDHFVRTVDATYILDCCPFNIAEYNLSVKLNAWNSDGDRQKTKLVWASRTPKDFLQFQYSSIGSGVTTNDNIRIYPIYKEQKDVEEFKLIPQSPNVKLNFDEVDREVDEIIFSFHMKNNQIKNLTNIVIPCMMVPIVFTLSNDRESKIQLLLTGILTLVFTMPSHFKFGTSLWYLKAALLVCIAFLSPSTKYHIRWISVLTTFTFLIRNFYLQKKLTAQNMFKVKDVTKGAMEESLFTQIMNHLDME